MSRPAPTAMLDTVLLDQLKELLADDELVTEESECWPYGYDNSRRHAQPYAVVLPSSAAQVKGIIELCNQYNVPLIARGKGTGTTGATVPTLGGIILSTEKMQNILKMDPANRMITVEPGVTNQQVQQAAAEHGFFWPPDPTSSAFCSIGGNLAYNSAGPRAVKYGTTRDNTLALKAITGSGESIITGSKTTKGVVGYDLTRLLIGSEGTLAIITEATLKLTPLAESKRTLQVIYDSIDAAAKAVSAIMAQPVTPSSLEFMDGQAIQMVRNHSKANLPEEGQALLMIEVDGPAAAMNEMVSQVIEAASVPGMIESKIAESQQEVDELWATRKALSPSLRTVAPKKINEDVVVPVSNIPQLINGLAQLAESHQIKIVNFGHAGNGNIHVNLLVNPDDPAELKRAHSCLDDVFSLVLQLEGTISGEHGIGIEKREFVSREIPPPTLNLMHQIKSLFDPNNILNPGKTLPDSQES